MRAIFSPTSLSVVLLSLLGADEAYARQAEDAFGITTYGFQCSDRIYRKFSIYSAAKRLCDTIAVRPNVMDEISVASDFKYPWDDTDQRKFGGIVEPPYFLQPILSSGMVYPINLPSDLRKIQESTGEFTTIDPGPDRLMISKDCRVLDVFTDINYGKHGYGAKIVRCTPLPFSGSQKKPHRRRPSFALERTSTRSPSRHSPEELSPGFQSPGQQSPQHRVPSYRSNGHQSLEILETDRQSSGHRSPEIQSPH